MKVALYFVRRRDQNLDLVEEFNTVNSDRRRFPCDPLEIAPAPPQAHILRVSIKR